MQRKRIRIGAIYVATALATIAFVGGFVAAAALTITNGPSVTGVGNYNGDVLITGWSESAAGLSVQGTPLPTVLSSAVATPTVLVSGTTYGANALTANDIVQVFKFSQTAGFPINTEVELIFTISTGAGPTVTTVTVFGESGATAGAFSYTVVYDLGSAASATLTLNSGQQITLQCSAVGTCP